MHTAEARAKGESEQRIYLLAAWHEAPVFTPRERAALGWTDALTRLAQGPTQSQAREALDAHFTAEEQMSLTGMINVINGWKDRKSVVSGKSVAVRVDLGGRRMIKKKQRSTEVTTINET